MRGSNFAGIGVTALALTGALLAGCAGPSAMPGEVTAKVDPLLASGETILGQPIAYPSEGQAEVTAVIVSLQPGEATGWHEHEVPLFALMLDGELTVDYGANGSRTYVPGDSILEAIDHAHNGTNTGRTVMRVLAVFMGADGASNTVAMDAPE